ncbi:MAG: hypothetical protein LBT88_01235 [Oscillospiraceae bacterium]|jgi:hypothetical protein|nr:hypothetical protein [Oscillospiraceae bacterium]
MPNQKSVNAAFANASRVVAKQIKTYLAGIDREVAARGYRVSNQLRNSALYVLRGERSGRRYLVPDTKRYYTASAPGESPANRLGIFRLSWTTRVDAQKSGKLYTVRSLIESNVKAGAYLLGDMLEKGTKKMAARPYKQKVIDRALPKIMEIYNRPYKP